MHRVAWTALASCRRPLQSQAASTWSRSRCFASVSTRPQVSAPPPEPPTPSADHTSSSSDALDERLITIGRRLLDSTPASRLDQLYAQYHSEAGRVLPDVLQYEGRPESARRADSPSGGQGVLLVVHLALKIDGSVDKMTVCSGFAISVSPPAPATGPERDVIVTCAHTLEEIRRSTASPSRSLSFVLLGDGSAARPISRILSSTPRSDLLVLEAARPSSSAPLPTLPVSPFPVALGHPVLTHLFASPDAPVVQRSKARAPPGVPVAVGNDLEVEKPVEWLGGGAWRRWGQGMMLGYRSYVGQDVEAGTTSQLPYILTSILPTPGSSGGPLVDGETGAVVGMVSGRRMDNRVEGERGWGSAAEQIYEMFALPGFTPASAKYRT